MLNPDNIIPCVDYSAEGEEQTQNSNDSFLKYLIEELEEFKEAKDVRFLC